MGKSVALAGVDWLRSRRARVIGLETMPRTMDNIGFYSSLGFVPGRLTITLTLEAAASDTPVPMLGMLSPDARDEMVSQCQRLTREQMPGYDFTREILLTLELGLGDVVLLRHGEALAGFALVHGAPLVEGRSREELRVLKMVLRDQHDIEAMADLLALAARRAGTRRAAVRVQGEYLDIYRRLMARGARVRWTDLRMTLADSGEARANGGVVLSNWEI